MPIDAFMRLRGKKQSGASVQQFSELLMCIMPRCFAIACKYKVMGIWEDRFFKIAEDIIVHVDKGAPTT